MKREFQIIVKPQVDKELIPQIIKDKIHLVLKDWRRKVLKEQKHHRTTLQIFLNKKCQILKVYL